MQRKLAAIMVADFVGSTSAMESDEEKTLTRVAACMETVGDVIARNEGRVFNTAGDAVLAEFASPVNAVRAAMEARNAIAAVPGATACDMRFGLHLADVVVMGSDLRGDGVNVAARVQSAAEAGAIDVTGTLYDYVRRVSPCAFAQVGERKLKGISEPIRVYRVGSATDHHALATAPPERFQPSLVVLPFENLSGPDDDFFVEGVVEEVTATLSRVRDFFVIARQSANAYKRRRVDVREIGRELDVQYAVEGTVRRAADRVRVAVKLVHSETRSQIWSERYDRAATDIFALQDEIAARVAGAIHPALLNAEIAAARRKPPGSLRAYELVLRAYPDIWSAIAEDNRRAISLLDQAIAADPAYGRAHALLAWGHSQNVAYLWTSDTENERALALAEAEAASSLASNDPMTLTAIGAALNMCSGDQDRAAAYVEEALALDPNNAWAWARFGWIEISRDRPKTARDCFARALALSPFDLLGHNFQAGIAVAHGLEGDYAMAAKLTQRMLDKNPQVTWAYRQLASFSASAGDLATARFAIAKLRAANPGVSVAVMKRSHPLRHIPRLFDMFVEGWRLAGLPEE